jgi:uncharacterized protein (TIGR03086 family)
VFVDIIALLERGYQDTASVMERIPPQGYAASSPCTGWTVHQVAEHLVGSLTRLADLVEGETVTPPDLADDPVAGFRAAAKRSVAAFAAPGALERRYPFGPGPTPGLVLANLCLMESLVHGWDLAQGAGLPYPADDTVVAAVQGFTSQAIGDEQRRAGLFGAVYPTDPGADSLTALLAHLGRRT